MQKLSAFLFSFALMAVAPSFASTIQYTFQINTSSINGTTGSIDFALYPGAGSDQSLTASVFGLTPVRSPYTGVQTLTGSATGGPVLAGNTLTLSASSQDNDDLETLTFGNSLLFSVLLSGPALTAPDGNATSPYQFVFSTYSNALGSIPVLTTDAGGASGIVNVGAEAQLSTSAVSPDVSIAAATPEPASLLLLFSTFTILAIVRYARPSTAR